MTGGKYVLLEGDTLDGVIPSYLFFYKNLLNGNGIGYTWSSQLGINYYINLAGSLIFSISMPFYLLLNNVDYAFVTVIVLILKAGISSLFFYFYINKIWKQEGIKVIIFSVFYSMCAFSVNYIPLLLNFSDAIFMLPLILYFVSKYADEGKFRIMCMAYIYLFLNFFYSAYIVGFFSFFYLLLYMVIVKRYSFSTVVKKTLFFGLCILVSAGVTAVILYPMAYFIFTKYAEDATGLSEPMHVNILDIYNQLFIGQVCGIYTEYPYIYCGLPVMLLLPFYMMGKKNDKKEKTLFLILTVLMTVSCMFLPLYLFWHCMDAPDGDHFRFAFIISFLLCFMACRAFEHIGEFRQRTVILIVLANILIYVACKFIQPIYQIPFYSYPENTWHYFYINAFFFVCYLMMFLVYKVGKSYRVKRIITVLFVIFIISETVVNGYSWYYKGAFHSVKNNADTYKQWKNMMDEALDDIKNDSDGFYRISSKDDYIVNSPLYFGYNGISSFSNMENYETREALGQLGLLTIPRSIMCNGLTDFTRMIFSVKYDIRDLDIDYSNEYVFDNNKHATVIKDNEVLSLGFLVDDAVGCFSFSGRNQFININELASCMVGYDIKIFDTEGINVKIYEAGITVYSMEDGTFGFAMTPIENDNYGILYLGIPIDERDAFVQFDYGKSEYDAQAPILCDGFSGEYNKYERITASFIKPLVKLGDEYEVAIIMKEGWYDNISAPQNINFAYYNYDEFLKIYNDLKNQQMDVLDYGNDYVKGHIDVCDEHKILFTSIPYDEGWEVKVNGVKTEPLKLLDGAFIGLELPKGSYDIEFKYHVPGLKTGIIITLISLMLMIGLYIINPQIKTKVRPERKRNKSEESKGNNEEAKEFGDTQKISNNSL